MSAVFKDVENLLELEEGNEYVNDPNDHGGETKYGISKRSFPDVDIKNLTLDEAYEIYQKEYWDKYSLSSFKTQSVANKVMLQIVNEGDHSATVGLQRAIYYCGVSIDVDGKLGAGTIQAANSAPQLWLLDRLRVEYAYYYLAVVNYDISQLKFLHGWLKRALS